MMRVVGGFGVVVARCCFFVLIFHIIFGRGYGTIRAGYIGRE